MMIFTRWETDMGANYLKPTVRGYREGDTIQRYLRVEVASKLFGYTEEQIISIAYAAAIAEPKRCAPPNAC